MAFKKKFRVLEGKFIKQINDTLWKFQGTGNIAYIECQYPPNLGSSCSIKVFEKGMLGAFKRYKFCGFAPYSKFAKAYKTKKLLATSQALQIEEINPAFNEGKYKTYGYHVPIANGKGGIQKRMLRGAVKELTRVLRDAPENQIDVGLTPAQRYKLKNTSNRAYLPEIDRELETNEIFALEEQISLADRNSGKYDELGMTKLERAAWDKKQAEKVAKQKAIEDEISEFFEL